MLDRVGGWNPWEEGALNLLASLSSASLTPNVWSSFPKRVDDVEATFRLL